MKEIIYQGKSNQYYSIIFGCITTVSRPDNLVNNYASRIIQSNNMNIVEQTLVHHIYSAPAEIDNNMLYVSFYNISIIMKNGDPSYELERLTHMLHNKDFTSPEYGYNEVLKLYSVNGIGEFGNVSNAYFVNGNIPNRSLYKDWYKNFGNLREHFAHTPVVAISTNKGGVKEKSRNTDSYYARTRYDIVVGIYDNLVEAINNNEYLMYANLAIPFGLSLCRNPYLGTSKIYADIIYDTIIVRDNTTGYNSIKEQLNGGAMMLSYNYIEINQYGASAGAPQLFNFIGDTGNVKPKYAQLILLNRKKITGYRQSRVNSSSTILEATIRYRANAKARLREIYTTMLPGTTTRLSTYIIPFVEEENLHEKAMTAINELYAKVNEPQPGDRLINYVQTYILGLENNNNNEDDILVRWFNMATCNASQDEKKLRTAYETLKSTLIREYKEVETYLAHNSIGNKQPIPSVYIEEDLARSVEKKIAFEKSRQVLDRVGYQRLQTPIALEQVNIRAMIPIMLGKEKGYIQNLTPLDKLYNKKENRIDITMKGVRP